jgi:hypothetical protein
MGSPIITPEFESALHPAGVVLKHVKPGGVRSPIFGKHTAMSTSGEESFASGKVLVTGRVPDAVDACWSLFGSFSGDTHVSILQHLAFRLLMMSVSPGG